MSTSKKTPVDKHALAENPETSRARLATLSRNAYAPIRQAVAQNPNTSSKTLTELADDRDTRVFVGVSAGGNDTERDKIENAALMNPNIPVEVLSRVAREAPVLGVFHRLDAVAQNPNTPADALAHLWSAASSGYAFESSGLHIHLLESLAGNPSNTPEQLMLMAEEHKDHRNIMGSLAQNPASPADALRFIMANMPPAEAPKHEHDIASFRQRTDAAVYVARNEGIPQEIVEELLSHPNEQARVWLARNEGMSAETLDMLADDAYPPVRADVALNPNTEIRTLTKLAVDTFRPASRRATRRLEAMSTAEAA
ncbi:hypothetical protein [Citricoccus nitrophenolicus]|uniref:hypothetical protein n=1 Tax=Citricoccus nitrophenolicus TaxID=863575 RepID=UPI0031E51C41